MNTEATVTSDAPKSAPANNGTDGKRQKAGRTQTGSQQNGQDQRRGAGQQGRGSPQAMTEADELLLKQLLDTRLQNPFAKRELLNALKHPTSRFVAMTNGITFQLFRSMQDLDRLLNQMERQSSLQVEHVEARHQYEKEAIDVHRSVVQLSARVAQHLGRPNLILDKNVRDAFEALEKERKGKAAQAKNDAKAQAKGAGAEQEGSLAVA